MIVTLKPRKYPIHSTSTPIETFMSEKTQNMFAYVEGAESVLPNYLIKLQSLSNYIQSVDGILTTTGLPNPTDMKLVQACKKDIRQYFDVISDCPFNRSKLKHWSLGFDDLKPSDYWTIKCAIHDVMQCFKRESKLSDTIHLNFGVKLLYWIKTYKHDILRTSDKSKKILFYGSIKKHETYFLILLSKLGFDILILNPSSSIDGIRKTLKPYADIYEYQGFNEVPTFPNPESTSINPPTRSAIDVSSSVKVPPKKIDIRRTKSPTSVHNKQNTRQSTEQTYEQLALYAESVVMIKVKNAQGDTIGSGSGVVIEPNGYIVTNFHVVNKGSYYEVLFEDNETVYQTNRLVKYHTNYDLALIKVDAPCKAIQLSQSDLVRGQHIVSIGSPLGLFNTISEGIVSGFRQFDGIDMVQISAPISAGSSGGALLNMYGELVGITTAGFDDGQNLNLTVPSKYIKMIVGNILNK